MSDQKQQAIYKAAAHWGKEMGWTAEETLDYVDARYAAHAPIMVEAEGNSFSARGQAQKVENGLVALRNARHGQPSRQWLKAWGGENE